MLIKSWEKKKGEEVNDVYLYENEIVVGNHYGTGQTDNAGTCSIEKFIEGQFQDLITEKFGNEVLAENHY